jgi:hypothetical protein
MKLTKVQLQNVILKAYSLGYEDRVNQEGYNIAALEIRAPGGEVVRRRLLDPKVTKRPKHLSKAKVVELATAEMDK